MFNSIKEILQNSIKKYSDNNAFIIKDQKQRHIKITYNQLGKDIEKLGIGLIKMGLKNKRIAIIGKNRYEWVISYYATVCGVGIVVPLDKGLPIEEIENSLIISKADAIIFEGTYLANMKEIIKRSNTNVKTLICMDSTDEFINLENILHESAEDSHMFWDLEINNDETSIILFTSGTTSIAKAVELSHRNIASNVDGINTQENIFSTDVNMAFLPFHHTFGSTGLLVFLCNGATTVFCDGLRYIQKNLKEYKVTVFFCVPLIIESMHKKILEELEKQGKQKKVKIGKFITKLLLSIKIDIRRKIFKEIIDSLGGKLRFIISGAAPLNPEIERDFNDFGILTIQGYGLTETSPVLCAENEKNMKIGSVGKPLHNVEIKIDNPNEDGVGEIIARGPSIMKGYYNNKKATSVSLKDGWFYTGDLGKIDKKEYLYISGRKKNVIVLKNGKNIYPEELELLISNLPYVEENIVFGLKKDDDYILAAKIVYNKNYIQERYEDITDTALEELIWKDIKLLNINLCNYKHIKKIFISSDPMIKTSTNKIKRNEEIHKHKYNTSN